MANLPLPFMKTSRSDYDGLETKEANMVYYVLEADGSYREYLDEKLVVGYAAISATYSDLSTLKSSGKLMPGQVYLISDYKTTYIQPVSNKAITCDAEPLYITAVSNDKFAPTVVSSLYPTDIIYYNFDDNKCENNSTPRPGFILRRIDPTRRIDMPNDWRFMKWARFKVDTSEIETWEEELAVTKGSFYITDTNISKALRDGTPTSSTDGSYFVEVVTDYANNYFLYSNAYGLTRSADYAEYYTFDLNGTNDHANNTITNIIIKGGADGYRTLPNNVWRYSVSGERPRAIFAGSRFENNSFGANSHSNTFGSNCPNNTFGSNCPNNTFGSNCANNTFGSNCPNNTFGSNCPNNIFGMSCANNTFGSNCHSNMFGASCSGNTFASNFSGNMLGSNCHSNMFGANCPNNTFGASCSNNIFGSGCANNIFKTWYSFNRLESYIRSRDFSGIAEVHNKSHNHDIFINSASVVTVHWRDSSNQDQFLAVT